VLVAHFYGPFMLSTVCCMLIGQNLGNNYLMGGLQSQPSVGSAFECFWYTKCKMQIAYCRVASVGTTVSLCRPILRIFASLNSLISMDCRLSLRDCAIFGFITFFLREVTFKYIWSSLDHSQSFSYLRPQSTLE
jgi:hypothetical protein